jgi:hypothetical protein
MKRGSRVKAQFRRGPKRQKSVYQQQCASRRRYI